MLVKNVSVELTPLLVGTAAKLASGDNAQSLANGDAVAVTTIWGRQQRTVAAMSVGSYPQAIAECVRQQLIVYNDNTRRWHINPRWRELWQRPWDEGGGQ